MSSNKPASVCPGLIKYSPACSRVDCSIEAYPRARKVILCRSTILYRLIDLPVFELMNQAKTQWIQVFSSTILFGSFQHSFSNSDKRQKPTLKVTSAAKTNNVLLSKSMVTTTACDIITHRIYKLIKNNRCYISSACTQSFLNVSPISTQSNC